MVALLVTPEGLPVGYELFPGKTYEGHTLIGAIAALRVRYPGTRFTMVADAGLINRENEKALREKGIAYKLGARLKGQSKAVKAKVLDPEGYRDWTDASDAVPVDRYRCIGVCRVQQCGPMNLMVPYTPVMILDDSGDHPTPVMWNQGKDISPLGVEFFTPVFLFADNLVITPGDRLVIRDVYFKIRNRCCVSRFSSADCLFFHKFP